MMPNGKFLALMREGYGAPAEIRVVLNWFEELTTQVPVDSRRKMTVRTIAQPVDPERHHRIGVRESFTSHQTES